MTEPQQIHGRPVGPGMETWRVIARRGIGWRFSPQFRDKKPNNVGADYGWLIRGNSVTGDYGCEFIDLGPELGYCPKWTPDEEPLVQRCGGRKPQVEGEPPPSADPPAGPEHVVESSESDWQNVEGREKKKIGEKAEDGERS